MIRRTVYFSGYVQGVGFRFVTRQIAAGFSVKGYVRNLRDGRVELVVEGEQSEVESLIARIGEKMQGYVAQVAQEPGEATGEFHSFEIRR